MDSTEAKEIREDIHKLELKLVEEFAFLKAGHETIRKDLENRQATQDKILSTVYGNGQEGLVTKVAKQGQRLMLVNASVGTVCIATIAAISKYIHTLVVT